MNFALSILAAGRGLGDLDDWVQITIFILIVFGSVISGVVNSIKKKMEQKKEAEASSRRAIEDAFRPPTAKPMPLPPSPSPFPAGPIESSDRPIAKPMPAPPTVRRERAERPSAPKRTSRPTISTSLPPIAGELIETLREFTRTTEPEMPPAAPPRTQRVPAQTAQAPRPQTPKRRKDAYDAIEEREERRAKSVTRRIGHVESHIRESPASDAFAIVQPLLAELKTDPRALRNAILMMEILGPPLCLKPSPSRAF